MLNLTIGELLMLNQFINGEKLSVFELPKFKGLDNELIVSMLLVKQCLENRNNKLEITELGADSLRVSNSLLENGGADLIDSANRNFCDIIKARNEA